MGHEAIALALRQKVNEREMHTLHLTHNIDECFCSRVPCTWNAQWGRIPINSRAARNLTGMKHFVKLSPRCVSV